MDVLSFETCLHVSGLEAGLGEISIIQFLGAQPKIPQQSLEYFHFKSMFQ